MNWVLIIILSYGGSASMESIDGFSTYVACDDSGKEFKASVEAETRRKVTFKCIPKK